MLCPAHVCRVFGCIQLDFQDLLGAEFAQVSDAVRSSSPQQFIESQDLALAGCDNHFAAHLMGYLVFPAWSTHSRRASTQNRAFSDPGL